MRRPLILAVLLLAPASFAASTFPSVLRLNAGGGILRDAAVADFNGDGHPDIAVANDTSVQLLFNHGGPTLDAPVALAGGGLKILAADVNGDGKADLIIAGLEQLSVRIGIGDGTFNAPAMVLPGRVIAMSASDVNGDGRSDVVAAVDGSSRIVLLLGGTGGLALSNSWTLDDAPRMASLADADGDGQLDIVTSTLRTVYVLAGHGDGTFTAPASRPLYPEYVIASFDLDHDGKPEWLIAGNSLTVSSGTTTKTYPLPRSAEALRFADMNGDGEADVVVQTSDSTVVFLTQHGTTELHDAGAFDTPSSSGYGFAVADMNGDGKLDVVTGNNDGTVSIIHGRGNGTLESPVVNRIIGRELEWEARGIGTADFNEDGHIDAAVLGGDLSTIGAGTGVGVFLGAGDGSFRQTQWFDVSPTEPLYPFGTAGGALAADVDGDGHADILLGSAYGIYVLYGAGDGTFPVIRNYQASGLIAVRDVFGDGRMDLVLANGYFLPINHNRTADGLRKWPVSADTSLGDQNGDGLLDEVQRWGGSGGQLFVNDGRERFHIVPFWSRGAYAFLMGDLDGDRHDDVIGLSGEDINHHIHSALMFQHSSGNGTVDPMNGALGINVSELPLDVHVSDLDGDSRAEILYGDLLLWNKGNLDFEVTASRPGVTTTSDVDGDGTRDLLVTVPGGFIVLLAKRTTSGTLPTKVETGTVTAAPFGFYSVIPFHVSAAAGTPSGGVTFRDSAQLFGAVSNTAPEAGLPLTAGDHVIDVEYGGDSNFAPSSTSVAVHVDKGDTKCTMFPHGNVARLPMRIDVTCTATGYDFAPLGGTISISIDGTAPVSLPASNQVSASIALEPGIRKISADYSGDANHKPASIHTFVTMQDVPVDVDRSTLEVVSRDASGNYLFKLQLRGHDGLPLAVPADSAPLVELTTTRGEFSTGAAYKGLGQYQFTLPAPPLYGEDSAEVTATIDGIVTARVTISLAPRRRTAAR